MRAFRFHLLLILCGAFCFSTAPADITGKMVMDACLEAPEDLELLRPLLPVQASERLCHSLGLPANAPDNYLGPNCFTAVLLWFNPHQTLEFVNGETLAQFLEGYHPIAREELKLGDLVVFERLDLVIVGIPHYYTHAAVYLGEGYVWNKLGPSKFYDGGDGIEFVQPAWTLSTITALEDRYETSTVFFFRKN